MWMRNVGPVGTALRAFTSKETWAASANLVVSLAVGVVFGAATVIALLGSVATSWIVGVGVLIRAGTLRLTAWMASFDRGRLERLGGIRLTPLPLPQPDTGASFRQRQQAWGRAPWLWRLPVYQLVRLLAAAAAAFVAVAWWWATIVCFVLAAQPTGPTLLVAWNVGPATPNAAGVVALVVAGIVGICAWPVIVRGALGLDVLVARELIGPSRRRLLTAEVSRLNEARTLAVESAEAERRRIERDLHDGLQPQLVSLALDLGLARSRFDRDPAAARSMVERAHEEAKRATADLRNLVRGIHPSVLDERGLDAALSALVAGCAVPVTVEVSLAGRTDPTREAIAYFVVAEAITNVTKHARAQHASVTINGDAAALHVIVADNGQGDARVEPGGGLAGLAARVASIDGTFTLSSPSGGPTRIEAVIPCAP
jgi:signal transduction histidine kinase